jgi:ABC-2 type transport system permease protein
LSQLSALAWLKWRLFVNSMRSRRAATGRAASMLGTLGSLLFSLAFAAGLGAGAYFLSAPPAEGFDPARVPALRVGYAFFLFVLTMAFMSWVLMPLAVGGGSRFEPSRMLLYPVSLKKLFAFDLVSDLTSLVAVFAVPSILALGIGAGLARGMLAGGLLVSLFSIAFGLTAAKMVALFVGALMQARRTRGEMVLALLGGVLGLGGALMGQLLPLLERYPQYLEAARWTPPGAAAYGLANGLRDGGSAGLWVSLLTLGLYATVCLLLAYRVARRTALGLSGPKAAAKPVRSPEVEAGTRPDKAYAGWVLPLVSPQLSAVIEKELRYAARNAQLRVIALMAVGLTATLSFARTGDGGGLTALTPYARGAGAVFTVVYIFMLTSSLSTNLFGYEGAGMRALVLSPVSRRLILFGKNLAVTSVTLALVVLGVLAGGIVSGDLSAGTLFFAALAFCAYAPLFALAGNTFSIRWPKRMEFGKQMNRSGVAGLLLLPLFVAMLTPAAAGIAAAHYFGVGVLRYVILGAFAAASLTLYWPLVGRQGRALARAELDILEAVTGKDGAEGQRITG